MMLALITLAIALGLLGAAGVVFHRRTRARVATLQAAARHADLRIAALEEERDRAVAAAGAKAGFLAAMSHEIRTPMSGVIGMLGLVAETRLDPKQAGFVKAATNSTTALLTIIDDILDFSRIEAGKLHLETIEFEVRSVVDEVAQLLAQRAHAKGLELTCLIHRDVPAHLVGDPTRLRQVLVNLGGNAVKFTARGAVRLRVELDLVGPGHAALRFEVTDSGIGLSETAQRGLFEAFNQADASTSRRFGGSGLGLSICRGLVDLMDGRIGISSSEGCGSTFWFTAKFSTVSAEPARPTVRLGTRVLVVEPSGPAREAYAETLATLGCEAVLAASDAEALAILDGAATPPDMVLVDSAIPAPNRAGLVQRLRQGPAGRRPRLVLVAPFGSSAVDDPGDGVHYDDTLSKPVSHQALAAGAHPEPLDRGVAAAEVSAKPGRTAAGQRAHDPIRVLVVEDHEINRLLVVEILSKAGFVVDLACNGAEGVERRFAGGAEVILMDCQMPVMDGFEATGAIRARELAERRPPIPIIALTASATQADRERCLAAGMTGYLSKPFVRAALISAIDGALEGRATVERPATGTAPSVGDEPIDLRQFEDSVGTDPAEVIHYLSLFRAGMIASAREIEAGWRAGEAERVVRAAHKLKGSSAMLGARRVAAIAAEIERLAAEGNLPPVEPALADLEVALRAVDDFAAQRGWRPEPVAVD